MSSIMSPPITNPLFCNSTNVVIDSKNSIRLIPSSVVCSPASKSPVAKSFRKSFLSISSSSSSSSWDDRVDHCTLLRNSTSCSITRWSFSSGASVSSLGKASLACDGEHGDYEECGREEDMPQLDAVVLVICTTRIPDFLCPWRTGEEEGYVPSVSNLWKGEEDEDYGTGLIMSGRRVLTIAEPVDRHTRLELFKSNSDTAHIATMLAIAPECDLAILTVDDDEFWKGVKPVEFGDMPSPGDKVIITYSNKERDYLTLITARVLRLGMTNHLFWGSKILTFQVNVNHRGAVDYGPAFDERGKCVGLNLQSKGNKSDFIPAEVIKHFIQDYDKNGAYTGLPVLGIKWQKMENPCLRMLMKMEHDEQGVLVTEVKPNYPESVVLKPYDVILSIDGKDINNDGTVPFLRGQRVEFSYLIGNKYNGDRIVIKVRRGSEILEFVTELSTHKHFVRANKIGRLLRYYIIGGFVFTTLTFPYLLDNIASYHENEKLDEDVLFSRALYEEHVVLCQVLKDEINAGYEVEPLEVDQVLVTFNNKPVDGLESLVNMVETCNEDFMKFTFANDKIFVLPTNIARSRTPDILKAHSVICAMSNDIKGTSVVDLR